MWLNLVFTSLLISLNVVNAQIVWREINSTVSPPDRRDPALVFMDGWLVLFGGRGNCPGSPCDDVWAYPVENPSVEQKWAAVNVANDEPKPAGRFSMISGTWKPVNHTSRLVVAVGEGRDGVVFNDVWSLSLSFNGANVSGTWTRHDPVGDTQPPPGVYGAVGGIFPGTQTMYVAQGFSKKRRYSHLYVFHLDKSEWEIFFIDLRPYSYSYPHARCLGSGAMVDEGTMVMHGGCLSGGNTGGPCPSWDSWVYYRRKEGWPVDPNALFEEGWTRLPDCASPRIYSAMALFPMTTPGNGSSESGPFAVLFGGRERWIGQTVSAYIYWNMHVSVHSLADQISEPHFNIFKGIGITTSLTALHFHRLCNVREADIDEVAILNVQKKEWTLRKATIPDEPGARYPTKAEGIAMATGQKAIYLFGTKSELFSLSATGEQILNSPIKNSCGGLLSTFVNVITLHGLFMFISWGVLLQAGAFIARYFRQLDPLWFKLHRALQVTGVILAFLGFALAVASVRFDHFNFVHGGFGILITILGLQQPFNACCRPHKVKGEPVARKRWIWEIIHKNAGRFALVLALINIALGFPLALAPVWSLILYLVYLVLIVLFYLLMEIRRHHKEKNTYEYGVTHADTLKLESRERAAVFPQSEEDNIVKS